LSLVVVGPDGHAVRVAAFAERFRLDGSLLRQLQLAGLAAFALAFAILAAYGQPGTGVGQGFFVAIVLVSLATGPLGGAVAGLAATTLYVLALVLRDAATWSDLLSTRVLVHGAAYVAVGVLVGFFAHRARRIFAESLRLIENLMTHSRRDLASGALEPDEFDSVLARRARESPIGLLAVQLESREDPGVTRIDAERLHVVLGSVMAHIDGPRSHPVGCTGPDQLSVIVPASSANAATSASLERALDIDGCRATVGWAAGPEEGTDALSLFGAALERVQARRLLRGDWAPTSASAGLVERPQG